MNTLKIGEVRVERARPPHCALCKEDRRGQRFPRPPSRDCLCHGTGAYAECQACGKELIGEDECFFIASPCRPFYDSKQGWVTDDTKRCCWGCLACTIADALPELKRDEWDEAEDRAS